MPGPDDRDKQLVAKQARLERIKQAARDQVRRERPTPELIIRRASEVPDEPLATLFGGRLVRGAFQLVVGPGEAGKGMQSVDAIARLTTGEPFPDETRWRPPTNVMVCVTEDAAARVKGRLRAAGADLDRTLMVDGPPAMRGGLVVPSPVAFDEDAGSLVEQARKHGVTALWLETTVEHLGDRDGRQPNTSNEAEVRRALSPVIATCRVAHLVGWGVMHPRKSVEGGIEDSISGSAGFRNVARTALHVYMDPADETGDRWRLLMCSKANYLARRPPTLRFRIEPWDKDPAEGHVVWGIQGRTLVDPRTAEEVWREIGEKLRQRSRRDNTVMEAEKLLRELLGSGEVPYDQVVEVISRSGLSDMSIKRARANLRIVVVRSGYPGRVTSWRLPAEEM